MYIDGYRTGRKGMIATAALLALGLGVVALTPAETQVESVWARAARTAERNIEWIPGEITVLETVRDAAGELHERSTVELVLSATEPQPSWEIVQATVNGEDVTNRLRHEEGPMGLEDDHQEYPFLQENEPYVQLAMLHEDETIRGAVCYVVEYGHEVDGVEWSGRAYIVRETGVPLRLEISTEESFIEDGVRISGLRGVIEYNAEDERWYPTVSRYTMNVRTRGFPLLGFEGSVESETHYRRYRPAIGSEEG